MPVFGEGKIKNCDMSRQIEVRPALEFEVTGAAFVGEKRSEHRRTALTGANFVCVEAGFSMVPRDNKVHESL